MTTFRKKRDSSEKQYKFKGFDWRELGECWKLGHERLSDTTMLRRIRKHLSDSIGDSEAMAKVADDIRRFLKALCRDSMVGYDQFVWKGLLNIKSISDYDDQGDVDETLIKFTIDLLPRMWT